MIINLGGGSYADGDNEAWGTTNETWLFNSTIAVVGDINYGEWYVDFISNDTNYNTMVYSGTGYANIRYYGVGTNIMPYFSRIGWSDEAYRTITITGGADKDNANFRAWLTANAVKQ